MKCPFCGDQESKVVDSRHSEDGLSIRRRRECLNCQRRFTTMELRILLRSKLWREPSRLTTIIGRLSTIS